jgi:hypothetical protein
MQADRTLRVVGSGTAGVETVVETYRRWLYMPSATPLLAVLGSVAANMLPGDPLWLLLVGPPGGGKSEILGGVTGLPAVHPAATMTAASLLSGTPKKEYANGSKGGLLREIGDFGILACKDFGSVLNMQREARAEVLAALREVYDGSWTRHVGTGGGQTLHWEGKVGFIGGCTPTIDRHHAVMGAMGERFLFLRLPEVDAEKQARQALAHAGREKQMRTELSESVAELLSGGLPREPRELSEPEQEALITVATLVVRCRSAVERDGYSREIELIPEPEAPTRMLVALAQLLNGLDAIGTEQKTAWSIVTRAALDSMPRLRLQTLDVLAETDEPLLTDAVASALDYPVSTTKRVLEDLTAHHVVERSKANSNSNAANLWALRDEWRGRFALVRSLAEGGQR